MGTLGRIRSSAVKARERLNEWVRGKERDAGRWGVSEWASLKLSRLAEDLGG